MEMAPETREGVQAEGERIVRRIEEARAACGPNTWPTVELLLESLLGLQGEALSWLVGRARALGAEALLREMEEDEFFSSLLRLHGLHPEAIEKRIVRGLERVRPRLGNRVRSLEFVKVEEGGLAVITVLPKEGAGLDPAEVERSIREVVLEEAPELSEVRVIDERLRRASMGMATLGGIE